MIADILPSAVVAVEARSDPAGVVLFAEEQAVVGCAVEKRRREFATARDCARRALAGLGLPPAPIPTGPRGEPCWPWGIVGSITHCHGYRACAVARSSDLIALGIDAEPNDPLPEGILETIARPEELAQLRQLASTVSAVRWDRLLFSAKESVYKAWFPLTRCELGFEDAALVIDPREGRFVARLLVPSSTPTDVHLRALSGRWLVRDGLVLSAVAVPI